MATVYSSDIALTFLTEKTSLLLISTSLGTDCALSSPGCFRLGRGKMDTRVRRSCWLLLLGLRLVEVQVVKGAGRGLQ